MGDSLSIIDFIVDNKFGTLLSIAIVLIVAALLVLLHEYKEQVRSYVFHRRNRGHFAFFLLYMASILILAKYSTLPISALLILSILNAIYFVLCIIGIKKPLGLAGIKLKQYQKRINAGLALESKDFFESKHWYLIDSIDKVRFMQLQSQYYAAVGKNKEGFYGISSVSDRLLYKKEQEDFLEEKARFLYEMGDLAALKEVLDLLESDKYKSQNPSLWAMKALIEEQRGDLDAAFSMVETAKAKLERNDASHEMKARALNDFGRIQLLRGNKTEAYHYYKQAFKEITSEANIYSRLLHVLASNVIAGATFIEPKAVRYYLNEYKKHLDLTSVDNIIQYNNCEITYYRQIGDAKKEFKAIKDGYYKLASKLDPETKALFQASTFRMVMNGRFQYNWFVSEIESSIDSYFTLPLKEKLAVFKEFTGILQQEEFRYVRDQEPFKGLIDRIFEYYRKQGIADIDSIIDSLDRHEIYSYHRFTLDKLGILKLLDREKHIENSESVYLDLYKTVYDAGLHITATNVLFVYIDECANPNNVLLLFNPFQPPITYQSFLESIPLPPPPDVLEDGIHLNYFHVGFNPHVCVVPLHRDKIEKHIGTIITEYHKWQNHPIKYEFSLHIAHFLVCLDRVEEAEPFYRFFVDSKVSINQFAAWMRDEYEELSMLFDGKTVSPTKTDSGKK
ncbi:MAG: tetratricopeptide repeat protein [Parabacteroides sp.]|nr:tetratricopeptide repeat protein [Parabacteroides sp.]